MNYSFKKLLHNDYFSYNTFILLILFSVFFVFFSVYPVLLIVSIIKGENDFHAFSEAGTFNIIYLIYFMLFIVPLILLFVRSYNVKHFQENCSEIPAKIENYTLLKNKGREVGYQIIFSYKYNNENYNKKYHLLKNKHTVTYLDNYLKRGETVRILVRNDNPKKILIKEVFV